MQILSAKKFQQLILNWFHHHGRKDLPWQQNKNPYRVWISEIMLQQTQVNTVIPYFQNFMKNFPDIFSLANAEIDEVLHQWTGLGYYSRARNLHHSAKMIVNAFAGKFPDELETLQKLPGIGRSTAGAILALAFQKPAAILDGNVKRVLARFYAIDSWPGEKKTENLLWDLAEKLIPENEISHYTQAMMDLGATICVRGTPLCQTCPLEKNCQGYQLGIEKKLPHPKPKKILPVKTAQLIIFQYQDAVFLEKKPSPGIWGGLWSLPEFSANLSLTELRNLSRQKFGLQPVQIQRGEKVRHTFSHFHFEMLPVFIKIKSFPTKTMESQLQIWYKVRQPSKIGLPAPIKKLLNSIT